MDVSDRTVAAALKILGDASTESVLALLTLEALHNEMKGDGHGSPAPAARTIAAAFPSKSGETRFSRAKLVEAMLARTIDDLIAVAGAHADGYLQAADTVRRGGGAEAILAAVSRDSQGYQPGGADSINQYERALHLCLAMSDDDPGLARQLREFLRRHGEVYAEAVTVFGKLFNRRFATGVTAAQLHMTLNAYLRGVQLHLRFGAPVDLDVIGNTVIRIYWSHTTPIAGPERNPVAELLAGRNPPSGQPRPPRSDSV